MHIVHFISDVPILGGFDIIALTNDYMAITWTHSDAEHIGLTFQYEMTMDSTTKTLYPENGTISGTKCQNWRKVSCTQFVHSYSEGVWGQ